ncbi:MAG TPA: hypothetical protein PLP25_01570 [Candidatus Limiplasma sp.]|nr:hypothetical protein [Candidatus Limiplasma sp.]HPS80534.1 hypothetical protein [Candidatus Limiplasma sp.]
MATDWLKMQDEYLRTPISLRDLAAQYGVSRNQLQKVASSEGWAAMKRAGTLLKAIELEIPVLDAPATAAATEGNGESSLVATHTERLAKLMAIGDQLTDQLARATVELDKQIVKHKRKKRELVYDGPEARSKPVEENVEEKYELEIVDTTVNCTGLQKLSATLRNLREVANAGGGETQSVDKVAQLMQKLDVEAAKEDD